MSGWIGVDLDGTLAHYEGWLGLDHIGEPIEPMMKQVHEWLEKGFEVKIFTARVAVTGPLKEEVVMHIHNWCVKHGLPPLEVTNVKDFGMVELYDDKAFHVRPNTGEIVR
jgi:hypothetical protein